MIRISIEVIHGTWFSCLARPSLVLNLLKRIKSLDGGRESRMRLGVEVPDATVAIARYF